MPSYKPNFFSIVLLGSHNPQILNHDFLVKHNILPEEKEPFRSLIEGMKDGKRPFSKFLSTPPVTSLRYKWISIIVEQNRYQIRDESDEDPYNSPIIQITRDYFGKYLRYTPFILGGLNFQGTLTFNDEDDEISFDSKLGIDTSKLEIPYNDNRPQFDIKIRYPWDIGKIEIRVEKNSKEKLNGFLNFNYEFPYNDIDSFIDKLNEVDKSFNKFYNIIEKLNIEINNE